MEAFSRAAGRLKGFFDELSGAFLEREDVLAQTALALLSREHVLLTGPPGTAKSQLARAVLGRIEDGLERVEVQGLVVDQKDGGPLVHKG